jgi:hypothetical protein
LLRGLRSFIELGKQGKIVNFYTSNDGKFNLSVRINPDEVLTVQEKELLKTKEENFQLIVNSEKLTVGSPEVIGVSENESIEKGDIKQINNIEKGIYKVDLYHLFDQEFDQRLDDAYKKDPSNYMNSDLGENRSCFVIAISKVDDEHKFREYMLTPSFG